MDGENIIGFVMTTSFLLQSMKKFAQQ